MPQVIDLIAAIPVNGQARCLVVEVLVIVIGVKDPGKAKGYAVGHHMLVGGGILRVGGHLIGEAVGQIALIVVDGIICQIV